MISYIPFAIPQKVLIEWMVIMQNKAEIVFQELITIENLRIQAIIFKNNRLCKKIVFSLQAELEFRFQNLNSLSFPIRFHKLKFFVRALVIAYVDKKSHQSIVLDVRKTRRGQILSFYRTLKRFSPEAIQFQSKENFIPCLLGGSASN